MSRTFVSVAGVLIVAIGAVLVWSSYNASARDWKTYTDSKWHFSVSYPSNFKIIPDKSIENYADFRIEDPSSGNQYAFIAVWATPDPSINEIFAGPYPKKMERANGDAMAIQRTINGQQGVELFGYSSEGHSYVDTFFIKGDYVWGIFLHPVIEGHITESQWPEVGANPQLDKDIYEKILNSFSTINK